ncbi:hypothetical protein FC15_GL001210 [Lapidilactobacillus concavus DSM 17758]|jgi:uncharacterized protein YkvS|uniref:DUF2187 domain-containing protein n=1 Tax=Lapidilactobacillus concavus DSM 17758 TaxID=1423735 RepID=A0A0R1VZ53_9LACO|nr:DUF2187 domain-containing protein [Lapidilactobacillus concavus]KRM10607.1 hypothetical protein FC15_GL001210 [Lapidilactobacillus concavus DSM 17758]GEL12571.1 hypothetical protein LCO01nite_01200 [Lapidilactobacillus concavus]
MAEEVETPQNSEFSVGEKISVRKSQEVPLSFKGTITKLYENSALVSIDTFEDKYDEVAADLQNKTVVGFKHIRPVKKD